jgi:Vps54-like protein
MLRDEIFLFGLALASQSLSIVFELIPYVRETFRRHLSPKQAVMLVEFDKLKRVCFRFLIFFLSEKSSLCRLIKWFFSLIGLSRASE